ncbi:MAG: hypothetical protein LBQ60_16480 [Bacteroidales bacterium]|jgi:hypothetical protein|nr:hypothetical protein [Bacteroidales bacterium]
MKKIFFVFILFISVSFLHAQDIQSDFSDKNETGKALNLSAEQITKIKKLNRDVGPKFEAIGRSNIPGYEKGQKKRALALEHKTAIRQILTENQIKTWESHYGNMDDGEGLRDIIKDDYDIRLKLLEQNYEKDIKMIEKSPLSEDEMKLKLKALKADYKNEKERLKKERDTAVESGILSK